MTRVSASTWAQLLDVFEKADAEADAAYLLYDAEPLSDNDDGPSELEQRYYALRAIADEHEDLLLAVEPPSASAAARQLRQFALRYHSADLLQPLVGEDREAAILRRIYNGLTKLG